MMKPLLLLLATTCLSFGATPTKTTEGKYQRQLSEYLNRHVIEAKPTKGGVDVRSDGNVFTVEGKNKSIANLNEKFSLKEPGDWFLSNFGEKERINTSFRVEKITASGLYLRYRVISTDGKATRVDEGVVVLPLKA